MIYRFRDWKRRRSATRLVTEVRDYVHQQILDEVRANWDELLR